MVEQVSQRQAAAGAPAPSTPGKPLAAGVVVFAVCMMIIIGLYHAVIGLAAIIENEFYAVGRDYVFTFDVTAWGWIHLISGAIVLAAAFSVFAGRLWARMVGITVAVLSAVENFFFIPHYPVWSVLLIALDVLVIYALAVYTPRRAEGAYGTR